jgi:hypothetical protein
MSYPLRLPAELDADARARCERLGISLNSLICVALDAYLQAGKSATRPPKLAAPRPPIRPVAGPEPDGAARPQSEPLAEHYARAQAAGVPEGFEEVFDPDEFAQFFGPHAKPDPQTEEGIDAVIEEVTGEKPTAKPKPRKRTH